MAMPTDPGDIATGATITETYLDRIRAFALWAGTGVTTSPAAWTSFSATLTQSGSVSMSTNACKYHRLGDVVIYVGKLVASASGTAANQIVISGLPVAIVADRIAGIALVQDSSAGNNYAGLAYTASTTSLTLPPATGSGATTGNLGAVGFTLALATGDAIWFAAIGEAA